MKKAITNIVLSSKPWVVEVIKNIDTVDIVGNAILLQKGSSVYACKGRFPSGNMVAVFDGKFMFKIYNSHAAEYLKLRKVGVIKTIKQLDRFLDEIKKQAPNCKIVCK